LVDSTGIKLLVGAAERDAEGDRLRMVRGPDEIQSVLRVAGIESRLPFEDA
jgi:hypothetical protein